MAQYTIFEGNIERLEKKIETIQRKCNKYGFQFSYQRIGETYKGFKDSDGVYHENGKYIIVEVEGIARHEGWEFIATIEHHPEGNIIRQYATDVEVPEKYRHTDAICEHCNTSRRRKDTYLVLNRETGEWKQVGKSCLKEFTNGLDAEQVAQYISWFDCLMDFEAPMPGCHFEEYFSIEEVIRVAQEAVNHWGYRKVYNPEYDEEYDPRIPSTKTRVFDWFRRNRPFAVSNSVRAEFEKVGFNPDTEELKAKAQEIITWVKELDDNSSYIQNVKIILADPEGFVSGKNIGFIVGIIPWYFNAMNRKKEEEERAEKQANEAKKSQFVGQEGQRITFTAVEANLVWWGENQFGTSYLYKFVDNDGNVYTWFGSRGYDIEEGDQFTITGTVKGHEEYKGVCQTQLTRCKLVKIEVPKVEEPHEPYNNEAEKAVEDFLNYCNA